MLKRGRARKATGITARRWQKSRRFDPRPHTGSDVSGEHQRLDETPVSIHAPARGATAALGEPFPPLDVSIHAPTRGATSALGATAWVRASFDPRPHAGSDGSPAVTLTGKPKFRSTPPRGERRWGIFPHAKIALFRSTPPRGERLPIDNGRRCVLVVSIHPPTRGATSDDCRRGDTEDVSIHAPTRGATWSVPSTRHVLVKFRSTPPRGERRCPARPGRPTGRVSIHAPTRGATSGEHASEALRRRFDPRPHAGSDLSVLIFPARSVWFRSTPPHGERLLPVL